MHRLPTGYCPDPPLLGEGPSGYPCWKPRRNHRLTTPVRMLLTRRDIVAKAACTFTQKSLTWAWNEKLEERKTNGGVKSPFTVR